MSFFKNNLTSKSISKFKNNFSKRFILENFGMLLGNKSFYRFLKLSEILLKTKNVKVTSSSLVFGMVTIYLQ